MAMSRIRAGPQYIKSSRTNTIQYCLGPVGAFVERSAGVVFKSNEPMLSMPIVASPSKLFCIAIPDSMSNPANTEMIVMLPISTTYLGQPSASLTLLLRPKIENFGITLP